MSAHQRLPYASIVFLSRSQTSSFADASAGSPVSAAVPGFVSPASHKRQAGIARFVPSPCSSKEPVGYADNFGCLIPVSALLGVFNDVIDDAALLIEFEDEHAGELLVRPTRPSDDARDLLDCVADLSVLFLLVRLAAGPPFDNKFFVAQLRGLGAAAVLHHALRQYLELHIANYRHPTPCDWRCP